MGKTIAIHQPNFFPWLGFFDKIANSDIFVYLDHVNSNPRSAMWTKRVNIIANNREFRLTVPLTRPKGPAMPINEMEIQPGFEKKHLLTIEQSYKNALFFADIFPFIENFYTDKDGYIANRNINFIERMCRKLDINTIRIQSSKFVWLKKSTDLLIEITSRFNGTTYISGGGASGYQEDYKFADAGIALRYQNFKHPVYTQINSRQFIPGLSVIDVLMNRGFEGTREILNIGKLKNHVYTS